MRIVDWVLGINAPLIIKKSQDLFFLYIYAYACYLCGEQKIPLKPLNK